jgi:SLOG cluster3 family
VGGLALSGAIFLSAGVPDPKRGPDFARTADTVAITAAVSALLHVTLGRRLLVWGGHPAITPMVLVVAEDLGVDYGSWVKLYQSRYFEDEFPEDNSRFQNVVYTDASEDREGSLLHMRRRMFDEQQFDAAVFIGGMQGIFDEFNLFRKLQPAAMPLPILSTGGAALLLSNEVAPDVRQELAENLDYIALFHQHINISVREQRYAYRDDQPSSLASRMWNNPSEMIIEAPIVEAPFGEGDDKSSSREVPGAEN